MLAADALSATDLVTGVELLALTHVEPVSRFSPWS
jgi:hypothetical protein